jgi:hypothetical protein
LLVFISFYSDEKGKKIDGDEGKEISIRNDTVGGIIVLWKKRINLVILMN